MEIIVIGGGVAGLEGALAVRRVALESSIRVFCAEAELPYRRPALTGMIAKSVDDRQFFLKSAEELAAQKIEVLLDNPVAELDFSNSQVVDSKGVAYRFDRLLLSCGARSFWPPIPGLEPDERIIGLRNFADLQAIKKVLRSGAKKAIILGGGPLALEQAEALIGVGVQVTILESSMRLLAKSIDAECSQFGMDILHKVAGFKIIFDAILTEVERKNDKIYCHTASGENLDCDFLLVSAGVRPVIELAEKAGLEVGRAGIAVDSQMRTKKAGVFAAGDCAEVEGKNYGLFLPAKAMGEIAGNNLAGGELRHFESTDYPVRLASFSMKLFAAGDVTSARSISGRRAAGFYKVFFIDDRAVGAVTFGDFALSSAAGKILEGKLSEEAAAKLLNN